VSYKLLVLSDLHLRERHSDSRYELFLGVLEKFKNSNQLHELLLMGDIFDILIGPKKFWKKIHPEFFNLLESIVKSGKKITWVQGNHDFQLGRLLKPMSIKWIEHSEIIERENCKIYISHGDLEDRSNKLHPVWRNFLTSGAMAAFIDLIPESLGEKVFYPMSLNLSRASRKSSISQTRVEQAKNNYRTYAQDVAKLQPAELILMGHSHVADDFSFGNHRYVNLGSWQNEKPLAIIHINAPSIDVKVYSASTWLNSVETQ
jgi:UDP-2,3-diacylglucosamine pyrophosphatase LpxH